MTAKRMPACMMVLLTALTAGAMLARTPAFAQSGAGFEPPPVLRGSELAPSALLKGPLHTVTEPVALDGYFGRFIIESKLGKFSDYYQHHFATIASPAARAKSARISSGFHRQNRFQDRG